MGNLNYHISYLLQVLVLALFWCYGLKRKKMFGVRVAASLLVLTGIVILISLVESVLPFTNPVIFSIPYIIIMVLIGIVLWLCFDAPIDTVLLILLLPTTAQLCSDAIGNFLSYYTNLRSELFYVNDIIGVAVMSLVSLPLSQLFRKIVFHDEGLYKVMLISCYSVVVCIFILNAFRPDIEDRFVKYVILSGYRLLMSAFVFFLVFSMLYLGRVRYQKNMTELLLKKEEEQHALTHELTELINLKYHDIKHIRARGESPEFFERDGKLLDIYDLLVDCGNEALNTILTEKNVTCNNANIKLTMLVDGKLLDFMLPVDIYLLFGNALDNAIECLADLPEDERHIKIRVQSVRNMIDIECENTCHDKLRFENGLPQTTKGDSLNHGFGTQSIADVCKKYGAEYRMKCDGERFVLSVLMPVKG